MDTEQYETVSIKKAGKIIKKLRLHDNDVLVIKGGTVMAQKGNMDALATAVGQTGVRGVIVVVADDLDDIIQLPEDAMREHGWYKFDSAAAAIMERIVKDKKNGKDQQKDQNDSVQPS